MLYKIIMLNNNDYGVIGERHCTLLKCKETGCHFPHCHEYYGNYENKKTAKWYLKMITIMKSYEGSII